MPLFGRRRSTNAVMPQLVTQFIDAVNMGPQGLTALDLLMAPDATCNGLRLDGTSLTGVQEIHSGMNDLLTALPDIKLIPMFSAANDVSPIYASLCFVSARLTGVHHGAWRFGTSAILPTNRAVDAPACLVFAMHPQNLKLTFVDIGIDWLRVLQQLEILALPAPLAAPRTRASKTPYATTTVTMASYSPQHHGNQLLQPQQNQLMNYQGQTIQPQAQMYQQQQQPQGQYSQAQPQVYQQQQPQGQYSQAQPQVYQQQQQQPQGQFYQPQQQLSNQTQLQGQQAMIEPRVSDMSGQTLQNAQEPQYAYASPQQLQQQQPQPPLSTTTSPYVNQQAGYSGMQTQQGSEFSQQKQQSLQTVKTSPINEQPNVNQSGQAVESVMVQPQPEGQQWVANQQGVMPINVPIRPQP